VKLIQGCGAGAPELGILPGAGAQIKNQKDPELSSKFRTGAEAMAVLEVAPDSFLDTNGFCSYCRLACATVDLRVLFLVH